VVGPGAPPGLYVHGSGCQWQRRWPQWKVWLARNRDGVRVARCTVERLMKALGCRAPDLVERNFNPSRPDALWVADFSSPADLGRVSPTWRSSSTRSASGVQPRSAGTQLDRSFTFARCVHDRKTNSSPSLVAKWTVDSTWVAGVA
jgi:hypothetical protein